ncbi:hypothetical protein [Algoriphagus machipongonensis]|uniref:Uncharacterized protein n=1 Tax=Algoriphagus machipongonensis TaxID=388413 RepID=A3HV21_9BACT|nr:hypothetical protein [Algoriphagus machipongonensis]EAZ81993.1 hypothetical protein ALPR1_02090 [Algoriphagus machipongonensis]
MSKNILFLIFFLSVIQTIKAQELSGTWRMAYQRSIKTFNSLKNPKDKSQTYEAFSLGNAIFEFNNDEVTIHNFINRAKKLKIKNGNQINFQRTNLNLVSTNQDSIVFRINDNIENYITLIPYQPAYSQLRNDDFTKTQWKVTCENNLQNPLIFHFLNSSSLIITHNGKWHGYASFSDWKIRKSGQYSVLQVSNQENLDEYIFYPLAKMGEIILANTSHLKNSKFPTLSEIEIVKTGFPTSEELSEIKSRLTGRWTFKEFSNPGELGPIDSLINLNFSINLMESGTYSLENKIESIVKGRNSDFVQNQDGKWVLSVTGTYFMMLPENSWRQYVLIHELTEDFLTIDLKYDFEDHSNLSTRIIMKRSD